MLLYLVSLFVAMVIVFFVMVILAALLKKPVVHRAQWHKLTDTHTTEQTKEMMHTSSRLLGPLRVKKQ